MILSPRRQQRGGGVPDLAMSLRYSQGRLFQSRLLAALTYIKVALAQSRRPHIAFSSGKDSTCVAALVHTIDPSVPLVWSDDELEFPETIEYMRDLSAVAGSQLTITLGHARHGNWFDPWASKPFWRQPFDGSLDIGCLLEEWQARYHDLTFVGLRKNERKARHEWLTVAGALYTSAHGDKRCNPIMDWTEDDVWGLIAKWRLPYNRAYDVLSEIGIHPRKQRIGPLPLVPRATLSEGWPELLDRLEARYGLMWV